MKTAGINNSYICDNCHKPVDQWEVQQLIKRTYYPGPNHDKCSSDIRNTIAKIVDLCPECMAELEELYSMRK